MTVFVYVNTSKQVGDPDHLKVFANADAAERGSRKTTRRAWPLSTRFWNEKGRQLRRPLWNYGGSLEIKGEGRSSSPLSWGNWKWSAQGSPVIFIDSPAGPDSPQVRLPTFVPFEDKNRPITVPEGRPFQRA
jgi:hypothetical protein